MVNGIGSAAPFYLSSPSFNPPPLKQNTHTNTLTHPSIHPTAPLPNPPKHPNTPTTKQQNDNLNPPKHTNNPPKTPQAALDVARDLKAKHAFGIHWGTFPLAGDAWNEGARELIQVGCFFFLPAYFSPAALCMRVCMCVCVYVWGSAPPPSPPSPIPLHSFLPTSLPPSPFVTTTPPQYDRHAWTVACQTTASYSSSPASRGGWETRPARLSSTTTATSRGGR
jgi:hypothetical protein